MQPRTRTIPIPVLVLTGWLALAVPARADVTVSLGTPPISVAPGAEFDLDLLVTAAGSAFNGFDAVVTYDPSVLTFMPATPVSNQQGCLMTGGCSGACGSTYHTFAGGATDSLNIVDVLLCDQISITGPGQLYRLHFKATSIPQTTHVRFRRAGFYNAGLIVTPVVTSDADIGIGMLAGVDDPVRPPAALALRTSPEPARGPVTLSITAAGSGAQIVEIHDVTGRLVRRLARGWQPAGTRLLTWDGRDDNGAPLASGVYLATARSAGGWARAHVTLLR
ncbi:MAG TPA: FlgD immunoglobulin-like domain containing protein [Dongiaceae bacterium]|nr:FlgD immunoglobulin-like domain containing protein [Dongiaceae bacterium]